MGDGGHFPVPGVSCLFSGEVRYLLIDFEYCWVSGVVEWDFVALLG